MSIPKHVQKQIRDIAKSQALKAGGLGALIGGTGGYYLSEKDSRKKGALIGALSGGLGGGAVSYLLSKRLLKDKALNDLSKRINLLEADKLKVSSHENLKKSLMDLDIRNLPGEIQQDIFKKVKNLGFEQPKSILTGKANYPSPEHFERNKHVVRKLVAPVMAKSVDTYIPKADKALQATAQNFNKLLEQKSRKNLMRGIKASSLIGTGSTVAMTISNRRDLEKRIKSELAKRNK